MLHIISGQWIRTPLHFAFNSANDDTIYEFDSMEEATAYRDSIIEIHNSFTAKHELEYWIREEFEILPILSRN